MASPVSGYIYVSDEDTDELSHACLDATIRRRERRPPWFVVEHSLESMIASRWPGKLWQATVVDAEGIDQACAGATRAWAVKICGQIPTSRLFGEHGDAVAAVITKAGQMNLEQVASLAAARHPEADDAYSRAWEKWLADVGSSRDVSGQNLAGTLAIPAGIGYPDARSPIGGGFLLVHRALQKRAESLVGPAAFVIDEEADERFLEPTWASAGDTLLEAAMAVGAPMLLAKSDRDILLAAWRTVFGSAPGER